MLEAEIAKRTLGIKSEVIGVKLKYSDIRDHLLKKFRIDKIASGYTKKSGGETATGLNYLDKFFSGMTLQNMAHRLPEYVEWYQAQPEVKKRWKRRFDGEVALAMVNGQCPKKQAEERAALAADAARDATINRSLGTLRSMYGRYNEDFEKRLPLSDIPNMPYIKNADRKRTGFIPVEVFQAILKELPENLHPLVKFIYATGMRSGAARRITWSMVSPKADELILPSDFMKNDEPWSIPLVGPLEPLSKMLKTMIRHADLPVFTSTNLRKRWNTACAKLKLGIYNPETQEYSGLRLADFRRTAARDLVRAGVSRSVAMLITGHKTENVFERYNIKDQTDVKDALIKVGVYRDAELAAAQK
jgi:integrase